MYRVPGFRNWFLVWNNHKIIHFIASALSPELPGIIFFMEAPKYLYVSHQFNFLLVEPARSYLHITIQTIAFYIFCIPKMLFFFNNSSLVNISYLNRLNL